MLVPIAAVLFVCGYALQAGLINPFITRPEHSQFLLLVALGLIIVNSLLIVFGPDARSVQTLMPMTALQIGPLIVDASKLYAGGAAILLTALLFAFFRFTRTGTAIRACADNYTGAQVVGLNVKHLYALTFAIGAACVGAAGAIMTLIIDVTPMLGPTYTLLAFVIVVTGGLGSMPGALLGGVLIGLTEAIAGLAVHAVGQEHVRLRHSGPGAAVPAARPARQEARVIMARAIARLSGDLSARTLFLLAALGLALLIAPFFANDYLLTVLILILYFAYAGQAWNIMMGFAGQLSLGHAIYVGLGAYVAALLVHALRHRALARAPGGDTGRGRLRRRDRLSRLSLRRRRRLFRHPYHRLCRIRPHRLRSSRYRQCVRRLVPAGGAIRAQRPVAAARQSGDVLLRDPGGDRGRFRAQPRSC